MRLPIALPVLLEGMVEQSNGSNECRLVPPSLNRSGYGWDHREEGGDGVRCGLSLSAEAGGFYLTSLDPLTSCTSVRQESLANLAE